MRRLVRFFLLSTMLLLIAFGGVAGFLYNRYHQDLLAPTPATGPNAIWLEHAWVGMPHGATEYDRLAALLIRHRLSDIFVHVGPLNSRGDIDPQRYPNAPAFLAAMKSRLPTLRIQAWIGQREARGGGPLNLSDASVRANIAHSTKTFTDLGFDGIHFNIEPIMAGDSRIIALLRATRATIGDGPILSIAGYEIEPFAGASAIARAIVREAVMWTADDYDNLVREVDQIAVMTYDTALPWDWLYSAFVEIETRRLLAVVDHRTTLFMGVPTYDDANWMFDPAAENVKSGLTGVRLAIDGRTESEIPNLGVAIYAGWTTDDDEWRSYRRLWLDQP